MVAPALLVADLTDEVPSARPLTDADLAGLLTELADYHAHFAPCFARRDQRTWVELYLRGLLTADVPRKNIEAMALRLLGAGPAADRQVRALQYCLSEGAWDDAALLAVQRRLVDETLGEAEGVLLIDGSDIPKQGQHSAGVARQWCGATGKKDNCQAGVFLGYASRRGYTFLDRHRHLPASWFEAAARDRWRACRIPDTTPFRTKPQPAAELVDRALADGTLRARWAVCDEGFGDDQDLRAHLAKRDLWYLAEVARDTQVWPLTEPDGQTDRPAPQTWVPPQTPSRKGPVPRRPRRHPASPATVTVQDWAHQAPAGGAPAGGPCPLRDGARRPGPDPDPAAPLNLHRDRTRRGRHRPPLRRLARRQGRRRPPARRGPHAGRVPLGEALPPRSVPPAGADDRRPGPGP